MFFGPVVLVQHAAMHAAMAAQINAMEQDESAGADRVAAIEQEMRSNDLDIVWDHFSRILKIKLYHPIPPPHTHTHTHARAVMCAT